MANINEIAYSVADAFGRSNDVLFINRVKFSISYYRAFLIRQDTERNLTDKNNIQSFCTKLEVADLSMCCAVDSGCKGKRTVLKIPKGISLKSHSPYISVLTAAGQLVSYYNFNNLRNIAYKEFTSKKPYYDYVNERLWFYNVGILDEIRVTGIFEKPESVIKCNTDETLDCYSEENYPISTHMINTIISGMLSSELRIMGADDLEVNKEKKENDRN